LRVAGTGQQRAFRWRDGVFSDLHDVIAPSAFATNASDINDLGTISGTINAGQQAFTLRGTTVTPLQVGDGGEFTFPLDINDRGQLIVDDLVSDSDPLKTFVHLDSALYINNRGDIVAIGVDSRTPDSQGSYLLRLVNE
jgi:hypothetical protein